MAFDLLSFYIDHNKKTEIQDGFSSANNKLIFIYFYGQGLQILLEVTSKSTIPLQSVDGSDHPFSIATAHFYWKRKLLCRYGLIHPSVNHRHHKQ